MTKNLPVATRPVPISTIQLCLLSAAMFLAAMSVFGALMWGDFSFSLPHGLGAKTQAVDRWTLVGVISVQCIGLFFRIFLLALFAQFLFLCFGSRLPLGRSFRASLLASIVKGPQLLLAAYAAWKFQDAGRIAEMPGSLAAVYPALANDLVWAGLAKQTSVLEILWPALFYLMLASEAGEPRSRVIMVSSGTWVVSVLMVWLGDFLARTMA